MRWSRRYALKSRLNVAFWTAPVFALVKQFMDDTAFTGSAIDVQTLGFCPLWRCLWG